MDVVVYDKIGKESDRLENLLLATFPQKTITDAPIASFSDGAEDIPIKSLSVAIEPVQDLHGQDAPYPAGGGKNLFQTTLVNGSLGGVTFAVNDDGSVKLGGTATINAYILAGSVALDEGTYTVNGITGSTTDTVYLQIVDEALSSQIAYTADGDKSFTLSEAQTVALRIVVKNGISPTMTIYPMVRLSSVTDGTFAPYTNICPISGHTSANVTRCGKNLFNEVDAENTVSTNRYAVLENGLLHYKSDGSSWMYTKRVPVYLKTGTYVLSLQNYRLVSGAVPIWLIKAYGQQSYPAASTPYVLSVTEDTTVEISVTTSGTTSATEFYGNIQLEVGSTVADYEPYRGTTYPITFPSGTTVYGGNITVNQDGSGSLVVDKANVDLGSLDWSYSTASEGHERFNISTPLSDIKGVPSTDVANAISDMFKVVSNNSTYAHQYDASLSIGVNQYIYIYWSQYTDAAIFKSAVSGSQLVYELATPITIPLTASQITTLLGVNNLWADTGNIESLTYRANLGDYINNAITTAVANALNV